MIPEIIQVFIELWDEVPRKGGSVYRKELRLVYIIFRVTQNDNVVQNSNLILIRDNTF